MARTVPPKQQIEFHGVHTSGNPANRPPNTAAKCTNFRVMPGYWLRLRSGRKARKWLNETVRRLLPFRDPQFPGSAVQIVHSVAGGTTPKWSYFNPGGGGVNQWQTFLIGNIATANDASYCVSNPAPGTLLSDRPLLYNGLGTRDASNSKPPFSTYYGAALRYFGLDAFCPGGTKPTVASAGAGNNNVTTSVSIYVGVYNATTNHYSNGVLAGTIGAGTNLDITVSNLARLVQTYYAGGEGELNYVFYATVDGGSVPYLILNSSLTGPLTAAYNAATKSLSVTAGYTAGYYLDLTKEMPLTNHPPRPMRSITFVNGRLYGVLLPNSGANSGHSDPSFSYIPTLREYAAVVWSQSSQDIARLNTVGEPLQCWPFENIAYTPSAEAPLVVAPAQDNVRVLVITPTSTFLLEENADGIHEWITVSRVFGIGKPESMAVTPYGICWVTQFGHIVMLPPNSTQLVYLSKDYQNLIPKSATVKAADYIFNASHLIDRYQIWLDDGTSVIHDFLIGGEGYNADNFTGITAAATVIDSNGKPHHMIASSGFYEHEAQYDDNTIPTSDQTYDGSGNISTTDIDGEYRCNWTAEGDPSQRKEAFWLDLLGDSDASALTLEWYADFEEIIAGNTKALTSDGVSQWSGGASVVYAKRFKPQQPHRFWFKFVLKLAGHYTDEASYAAIADQGDRALNFYGSILMMSKEYAAAVNRP
jgi:hypothetical protein